MAHKAVFLDRDHTLIEDPGYLNDPAAVKLLPGVELAIRSLHQAGYKIVVVTNQSGIARGMLTEETLDQIHAEVRRQLAEKGVHLDAIYYCPFHPEGTVEKYAVDSDLRKPKPGMLLKAAGDLELDVRNSWMVGDSPRDVEAGQRAGCRTIRVRLKTAAVPGEQADENVQADFTVRNLVDAARVILREPTLAPSADRSAAPAKAQPLALPVAPGVTPGEGPLFAAGAPVAGAPEMPPESAASPAAPPSPVAPASPSAPLHSLAASTPPPAGADLGATSDRQTLAEILRLLRGLAGAREAEPFSLTKMLAGVAQGLAVMALLIVFWKMFHDATEPAKLWAAVAGVLQMMALTLYVMQRLR